MDPSTALFAAVDRGDLAAASALLSGSPKAIAARFHGASALHRAAARGDVAMLELLITRGAALNELDEGGASALAWATDEDHDDAVDFLLAHGARPTLVDLAARGRAEELERALEVSRAQIDQDTAQGTALHAAVRRGRLACVQVLVKFGANLRLRDGEGRTPAELAHARGHAQVLQSIEAELARAADASDLAQPGPTLAFDSIRYRCGACAEEIVIDIDRTEGEQQHFVEDCPVCCRANVIDVHFERGNFARVVAELE
jgi:ankyrin repeat protein